MAKQFPRDLFNKGQRVITFSRGEGDEKQTLAFEPQKSVSFTEEEAAYMLKLFGAELIDMNNVSAASLANSDIAGKLEAQTRAQEAEIAKRLDDARALKAKAAYDAAIEEGFGEDEAREIAGLPKIEKAPAAPEKKTLAETLKEAVSGAKK